MCACQGTKGTPEDKLRLALVFLLTCEALPSDGDYERVTTALAAAGADTSALAYVRRMRRLNLTGRAVRLEACLMVSDYCWIVLAPFDLRQ